jgi:ribosomal protein S27AE
VGGSLTPDVDLALIPFREPKKWTLVCGKCNLGITANFCGQRRKRRLFTPIVKVYPRADRSTGEVTEDWGLDYEIAVRAAEYRARVCPRCGAA